MRDTFHEIYLHIVWGVKNREQMINKDIEKILYSIIDSKTINHKASVIAKGNTENHIHLLIAISPNTNIAQLVKEIKGSTSYYVNHKTKECLYWQDGYGVLSVSKSGIPFVKKYIENQIEHHGMKKDIIDILEKSSIT